MKRKNGLTIIAMIMMMGFATSVFAQVPQSGQEEMGTEYPQEQQQQTLPEDEQEHLRPQEEGILQEEEGVLQNEGIQQDESAFPQEQSQIGEADYSEEIEEADLPATVTTSLDEMYPDHEVDKVFRGSDNSYKVKVKNGGEKTVVYYDESGSFVKEEQAEDKDKDSQSDW